MYPKLSGVRQGGILSPELLTLSVNDSNDDLKKGKLGVPNG